MKPRIIPIPCCKVDHRDPTLDEVAESWQIYALPRLKQSTVSIYSGILRAHILPLFGACPLSELTGPRIEQVLAEKALCLAPRTVANISTVLRSLFTHAQALGHLPRMPLWTSPGGVSVRNTEVLHSREKNKLVEHL